VDETGTEAAAASAVVVAPPSIPRSAKLDLDRPFLFFIRETRTGTILFCGSRGESQSVNETERLREALSLSPLRLLTSQHHAGAQPLRDEVPLVVSDAAPDDPERARSPRPPRRRAELRLPDRLEELRREVERRKRLVVLERARERRPHRGVGDVAHDTAV